MAERAELGLPSTGPALAKGHHETEVVEYDLPGSEDDPVLYRSTLVQFPEYDEEQDPRAAITALNKHIWVTAAMRGELAKRRIEAHAALRTARKRWRNLTGFTTKSGATKPQIEEAKRRADPRTYEEIQDQTWIIDRCTEEMERMDADYAAASRSFSIIGT